MSRRQNSTDAEQKVARSAGVAAIALLLASGGPLPIDLHAAADPVGAGMDGGGCVTTLDEHRINHGFDLHCDAEDPPNSLDIDWDGNRFHLAAVDSVRCLDDPAIDLEPPVAGFDTVRGNGSGRLNDEDGATAEWVFTDAGAAGVEDHAAIVIRKASGEVVLDVSGTLTYGNHEAHE
jgi:hypothetical protein